MIIEVNNRITYKDNYNFSKIFYFSFDEINVSQQCIKKKNPLAFKLKIPVCTLSKKYIPDFLFKSLI